MIYILSFFIIFLIYFGLTLDNFFSLIFYVRIEFWLNLSCKIKRKSFNAGTVSLWLIYYSFWKLDETKWIFDFLIYAVIINLCR